jgi:hypothetical protein
MTLATDCLICVAAAIFAVRLWRANRPWALAFVFTSAASLFGGTYHGFAPVLVPVTVLLLWKATVFAIALASFFLLAGSGRILTIIGIVKLVLFVSWMITHNDFKFVIADYGITLLLIGIAQLVRRQPSTKWVLDSIAVSVIAALVQQSRFDLHGHFNHNDLYHVIQLVALWLLYRGGLLMNRSTAPPTTRPT